MYPICVINVPFCRLINNKFSQKTASRIPEPYYLPSRLDVWPGATTVFNFNRDLIDTKKWTTAPPLLPAIAYFPPFPPYTPAEVFSR